jgi:uncharacterized membrane protein YuzA (DUF378 family)
MRAAVARRAKLGYNVGSGRNGGGEEYAMPIDLSAVNWLYVGILALFAFVAALLGSLISFRNKFAAAIIAAVLFAGAFVFWTYYPHDNLPSPLNTMPTSAK